MRDPPYEIANVVDGYREWSKTYDAKMIDRIDRPLLKAMRCEWSNEIVLDLACGTGRIGSWLTAQGTAAVDGVDLTAAMLDRARTRGIYRHLAIADGGPPEIPRAPRPSDQLRPAMVDLSRASRNAPIGHLPRTTL